MFEDEALSGKPNDKIMQLAEMPNVVATPHYAYNTHQSVERLSDEILLNVQACLDGKPINVVN